MPIHSGGGRKEKTTVESINIDYKVHTVIIYSLDSDTHPNNKYSRKEALLLFVSFAAVN